MEEKEVRKTIRKRAPRKTTAKVASSRVSARKTTIAPTRKAPTQVVSGGKREANSKAILVGLVLFFILIGVSATIGYSDKGGLDVEQAISLRKQNANPEEKKALENVPTEQAQSSTPNGGLVGTGAPDVSQLVPASTEQASTSTSTTLTASSTDAVQEPINGAATSTASSSTDANASS